jgi:hypothetical protein
MATPLFSKTISIVIDGSTLGCATDFSLSVTKDMIEIACLSSSGAKQASPDLYGWTVSFSGLRMQSATVDSGAMSYDELVNNLVTSDASIGIYILPDVSANKYMTGAGYLTSISMEGGVGSPVTFSGEVQGSGPLTQATTA